MKNSNNLFRRGLSLALALVMCAGMLQLPAFAADEASEADEGTLISAAMETPEEPTDDKPAVGDEQKPDEQKPDVEKPDEQKPDVGDDEQKPVVDDEQQTVIDDEQQPIVDDEQQTVVDDEQQTVVDDEQQTVVDDEQQTVVDDEQQTVIDDEQQTAGEVVTPAEVVETTAQAAIKSAMLKVTAFAGDEETEEPVQGNGYKKPGGTVEWTEPIKPQIWYGDVWDPTKGDDRNIGAWKGGTMDVDLSQWPLMQNVSYDYWKSLGFPGAIWVVENGRGDILVTYDEAKGLAVPYGGENNNPVDKLTVMNGTTQSCKGGNHTWWGYGDAGIDIVYTQLNKGGDDGYSGYGNTCLHASVTNVSVCKNCGTLHASEVTGAHQFANDDSITVTKNWNNVSKEVYGDLSVAVQLVQIDKDTKEETNIGNPVNLNKGNDWSYTFSGAAVSMHPYHCIYCGLEIADTPTYDYEVREVGVIVSGENDETKEFTPDANGNITVTINDKEYTFGSKSDKTQTDTNSIVNGKTIVTSNINYAITNTYKTTDPDNPNNPKPETTSLTVNKVWDDSDNANGKRPKSVTVQLYKDGAKNGDEVTLNANNSWRYTWSGLDADGDYSAKETNVPDGYTAKVETKDNTVTITNTYNPETKTGSLTVEKVWRDKDNQKINDTTNLPEVTVNVKDSEGKEVWSVKLNKDNWKASKDNLPEGEYTVTEEAVGGYTTSYSSEGGKVTIKADAPATVTVTNTKTSGGGGNTPDTPDPEKVNLEITKVWKDASGNDLKDGLPNSVTVKVKDSDGKVVASVVLDAAHDWKGTVEGLDKDGTYTVEEDAVEGYTTDNGTIAKTGGTWTVTVTNTAESTTPPSGGSNGGGGGGGRRPTNPTPPDEPDVNIPDEEPPLTEIPDIDPPLTDIPEEDVPLTDIPDADVPLVEIPEEDVPLADVPQTGDNTGLWFSAAMMSACGLALLLKKRKE